MDRQKMGQNQIEIKVTETDIKIDIVIDKDRLMFYRKIDRQKDSKIDSQI